MFETTLVLYSQDRSSGRHWIKDLSISKVPQSSYSPLISFTILVVPALQMVEKPQDLVVTLGTSATMTCKFNYDLNCSWERKGIPIAIADRYHYMDGRDGRQTTDCSFTITSVSAIDLGGWKCGHEVHNMSNGLISNMASLMGMEVIFRFLLLNNNLDYKLRGFSCY